MLCHFNRLSIVLKMSRKLTTDRVCFLNESASNVTFSQMYIRIGRRYRLTSIIVYKQIEIIEVKHIPNITKPFTLVLMINNVSHQNVG